VFRSFPEAGRGAEEDEASQFSEAQKASIPKQGRDGIAVAEISRFLVLESWRANPPREATAYPHRRALAKGIECS
jgi:hypothetical protein